MSGPEAVAAFMFFGDEKGEVLAELQQVRHEVAELAERMDFAERMLAKPRE